MSQNDSNLELRKIPSLQFLYEVNSNGTIIRNVKSKRRLKIFKKSHNSSTEYWCTQVNIKGKVRKVFIHNVVAECWHGEKPKGMQTDHIDRNSLNNDYRNLRYVTKSEQMKNRDYNNTKLFANCLMNLGKSNGGTLVQPVVLKGGAFRFSFISSRKAAKFLALLYGGKEKSFTDKLHMKRKHIFDYDVEYLAAQRLDTATIKYGKEQSESIL